MNKRTGHDSKITAWLAFVALLMAAFNPICGSCAADESGMMACCAPSSMDRAMESCHAAAPADVTVQELPCDMTASSDLVMTIPDHLQSKKMHREDGTMMIPAGISSAEQAIFSHRITTFADTDHPVYLKNRILRI
ncbi:MAG: hypothetical protein AAB229_05220 [Candidatus Hydrogenedentota bacterium]